MDRISKKTIVHFISEKVNDNIRKKIGGVSPSKYTWYQFVIMNTDRFDKKVCIGRISENKKSHTLSNTKINVIHLTCSFERDII